MFSIFENLSFWLVFVLSCPAGLADNYARIFQDHAESMRCNLNRCGDERSGTRTEFKQAEDQQTRARVPRGGGVRQTTREQETSSSDDPHYGTGPVHTSLYVRVA